MLKTFNVLFFILISFSFSKTLLRTQCKDYGDDCDEAHFCCGDYKCMNNRCRERNEVVEEEEYTPRGEKCDLVHRCPDFYYCESHRCVLHLKQLKAYLARLEQEVTNERQAKKLKTVQQTLSQQTTIPQQKIQQIVQQQKQQHPQVPQQVLQQIAQAGANSVQQNANQ